LNQDEEAANDEEAWDYLEEVRPASGNSGEGDDDDEEEENEFELMVKRCAPKRAKTAPLKPTSEIDDFKKGSNFGVLEQAAVCAVQLVQRGDLKFDLDSFEGQNSCKKFLGHIEKLCDILGAKCSNRSYRKKFSNAYKVLYKEGKLCYLTEILDSAQEGNSCFPYLS